jgi:hypothetical protein
MDYVAVLDQYKYFGVTTRLLQKYPFNWTTNSHVTSHHLEGDLLIGYSNSWSEKDDEMTH